MRNYNHILESYKLDEIGISIEEYTSQAEHIFCEEGTPEETETNPHKSYIDTVKGVEIYYEAGTDTYYFAHEEKDLFEHYEEQPEELQRVLKPYEEHNPTYESLRAILKEVNAIGYTFDYGLDATPYNLRKM